MVSAFKKDALDFLSSEKSDNLTIRSLIAVSKIRMTFQEGWRDMASYMINS